MASLVIHDTLISGYLAVRGLSIINKQLKVATVIKVMFSNNFVQLYTCTMVIGCLQLEMATTMGCPRLCQSISMVIGHLPGQQSETTCNPSDYAAALIHRQRD